MEIYVAVHIDQEYVEVCSTDFMKVKVYLDKNIIQPYIAKNGDNPVTDYVDDDKQFVDLNLEELNLVMSEWFIKIYKTKTI